MNELIEMIKAIKNPKEYVLNYSKQNSNPILNNLIDMANKGNNQEVERITNNILKQQGIDINEVTKLFK